MPPASVLDAPNASRFRTTVIESNTSIHTHDQNHTHNHNRSHSSTSTDEAHDEETISRLFAQQSLYQNGYQSQRPTDRLHQMSVEERSRALHDLHGVSDAIEETPEMMHRKLQELHQELHQQLELQKLRQSNNSNNNHKNHIFMGSSLHEAMRQNPLYVDKMRLAFLRAASYDAKQAATRMANFFDLKRTLFGADKLGRDICLQDLDPSDFQYLETGYIQLLGQRDRAGRAILLLVGRLNAVTPLETTLRILLFSSLVALQDEEIQKKGFVMVYYGVGQTGFVRDRASHILQSWWCLPIRIVAAHACYDKAILKPLMTVITFAMESNTLCRFRAHYGTHLECVYILMTFGIPKDVIPIQCDGQIDTTHHLEWLKALELQSQSMFMTNTNTNNMVDTDTNNNRTTNNDTSQQQQPQTQPLLLVPGPMDVVMGRGRHGRNSPGNLRLKLLLEKHQGEYEAASKFDKTLVSQAILKTMKDGGCRFLKPSPKDASGSGGGGWVLVEEDAARDKISHAFRNLRGHVSSSNAARTREKRQYWPTPFHTPSAFQSN